MCYINIIPIDRKNRFLALLVLFLGASTLQLAVFSDQHWNSDKWTFLLSCSDSSQLADGAAVAIIFQNTAALKRIMATGRCNTNVPTTLTGIFIFSFVMFMFPISLIKYNLISFIEMLGTF